MLQITDKTVSEGVVKDPEPRLFPLFVIPAKESVAKVESSPVIILVKAGMHLAVDSLFRRNDGNSQGFKPFSTPLKSGVCGEKWIPAFARMTVSRVIRPFATISLAVSLTMLLFAGSANSDAHQTPQLAVKAAVTAQPVKPDFGAFTDVKEKKQAFFSFMLPLIEQENAAILAEREKIIALSSATTLSEPDQRWLKETAQKYRMPHVTALDAPFFTELLTRVDVLPPSLALAQSANESAWGTSRFAREGNNFFGQWCFIHGCGMVPRARDEGAVHEVEKFPDAALSVRSYLRNLNSHDMYQQLRDLRAGQRQKQEPVTGVLLAQGLKGYSSRGDEYIKELVAMINFNKLQQYDVR